MTQTQGEGWYFTIYSNYLIKNKELTKFPSTDEWMKKKKKDWEGEAEKSEILIKTREKKKKKTRCFQ